jgi:hypothetical protein
MILRPLPTKKTDPQTPSHETEDPETPEIRLHAKAPEWEENDHEEAATVLRAHGAQVSLFFAAEKGMTDEIAACIAAGQDVNARDQVIFLCVRMGRRVGVAASLV